MKLEIEPGKSVGPIKIGMMRRQVRIAMKRYKRVEETSVMFNVPIDYFGDSIKVMYSKHGICEAIEVSSPAKPTLYDKLVLGRPLAATLEWFKEFDQSARVVDDGISALKSGVGVFIPNAKRLKKGRVQAVIVFVAGYYEKYSLDNI